MRKFIVRPGVRYPEWELFEVQDKYFEHYICEIQAANAADAQDSAKEIIKWWGQDPVEFEA